MLIQLHGNSRVIPRPVFQKLKVLIVNEPTEYTEYTESSMLVVGGGVSVLSDRVIG